MTERVALSLDLDGVLFGRPPFQFGALKRLLLNRTIEHPAPDDESLKRAVILKELTRRENWSLRFHNKRRAIPNAKEHLSRLERAIIEGVPYSEKVHKVFNTGRPHHESWVNMTIDAFKTAEIDGWFDSGYFKPEGAETRDSKRAAVKELLDAGYDVLHIDDNPEDGLHIASLDKNRVQVIIIQDLSTGILFSRVEKKDYPNVTRVAGFENGVSWFEEFGFNRTNHTIEASP